MKPPPFGYSRPSSLDEALVVLDGLGADGKVLAGGQSLLPLLSMRLASPAHLVDINRVAGLDRIEVDDAGVRVGATARHAAVEAHEAGHVAVPLLRQALRHVAHPTIRNRGTTVGSLAHADPSGEMTAVLGVLGGSVEVAAARGRRTVAAADFFLGPLESAVRPGELAVSAWFPRQGRHTGSAWVEVARRHGDYAVCGVGALVSLDGDRHVTSARVGLISVAPVPVVVDVSEPLAGHPFDAAPWSAAGALAVEHTDAETDIHATADYRCHLVQVLTARALADAARHAVQREPGGGRG